MRTRAWGDGVEWGGRLKQLKKAIPNEVEQRMNLSKQRLKCEMNLSEQRLESEMMAAIQAETAAVNAELAAVKAEMVTKAELNEMRGLLLQLSASMANPDNVQRTDHVAMKKITNF